MSCDGVNPRPLRIRLLDLPFKVRFAVHLESLRVKRSVEQVHPSQRCVNPVAARGERWNPRHVRWFCLQFQDVDEPRVAIANAKSPAAAGRLLARG